MRHRSLKLLPLCLAISCAVHAQEQTEPTWVACSSPQTLPVFRDNDPSKTPAQRSAATADITGDEYDLSKQDVTVVEGNVVIERADQWIGTDKVTYQHDAESYETQGNVRYQDDRVRMQAEQLKGNDKQNTVELSKAQYQFNDRLGNGSAQQAKMIDNNGELKNATYSTCPPNEQEWSFRASEINLDGEKERGVARNATLRIGKFPIFWTPYISFPTTSDRRTGLLAPTIGYNDRNGFDYKQPIYLNLAPNFDATLSPRYMSRRGWQLGTEFRYLTDANQGEIAAEWIGDDRIFGDDRYAWKWIHSTRFNAQWSASANINRVSDTLYFNDLGDSLINVAPAFLTSSAGVYGRGERWRLNFTAEDYQISTLFLPPGSEPYARLPRLNFLYSQPIGQHFEWGIGTDAVRFQHDVLNGGRRFDLRPYLQANFGSDAWYLKARAVYSYTRYSLDSQWQTTLADLSPTRSAPIFSLDLGAQFERNGENFVQTLEPRLFYLRVPYRDQSNLPIFDTGVLSFDWPSLFRENRFAGNDRLADANQATLALTHRWLEQATGRERFNVSLGRIFYIDEPRVLFPGEPTIENPSSDWVFQAQYNVSDRWDVRAAEQWSPRDGTRLRTFGTQFRWDNGGLVNVSYRYRRDWLEQTDLSWVYPLGQKWSVVGRWNYALDLDTSLEKLFGLQWKSCCMAFRVMAREYIRSVDGSKNRGLYLELQLNGLGEFGQDTGRLLENAIYGYTP
jgi:LPS-assembly protein